MRLESELYKVKCFNMIDIKRQIESILEDLVNNASISSILLKAQAIAFYLENEEFANWIKLEQNGYDNKIIPEYRKAKCSVKINVNNSEIDFPTNTVKDKKIREYLSYIYFNDPISIVEQWKNDKSITLLKKDITSFINKYYPVNSAHIVTDVSIANAIIDSVKSTLLNSLLKLTKQFDLCVNFDIMANKDKTLPDVNHNNISIVNNGNMSINQSEIIGGNKNDNLPNETKCKIESILERVECLEKLLDEDEQDIIRNILEIRQELDTKTPNPTIIKRLFEKLKTFKTIVAEKAIECGIEQVIKLL